MLFRSASKLAGEAYCSAYFRTYGIHTVALRFGNVYGTLSNHKGSVVAKFIRQALKGETLEIYGDGNQTRDFIYVDDLIRAIRLAANALGIGGEIFQIATNSETSIRDLVKELVSIFSDFGINGTGVVNTEPRRGDVQRNFSDIRKAREMLGWVASVRLRDGLEKTVRWFFNSYSHNL